MTVADFLSALGRRWYVGLVVVLMLGLAGPVLLKPADTYWGRLTLVVLPPKVTTGTWNVLLDRAPVAVASLSVMEVNQSPLAVHAASSDATLVGLGVTDGVLVQVRATGGQWTPAAGNAYIDVEAAGPSVEIVEARLERAVADVRSAVAEREVQFEVAPRNRTLIEESSGDDTSVVLVPVSRSRALGGIVLLGGLILVGAVLLADRRIAPAWHRLREGRGAR
ncbi:hypothetical protein [Nocardioides sambongensis]|uniref:hypothetical protein n=1 Tax=Nocardioides sambongensis TaxID=2589074 RepID=UPI00112D16DC|nr:hypothetical protein [Nocardioides sambongensis]